MKIWGWWNELKSFHENLCLLGDTSHQTKPGETWIRRGQLLKSKIGASSMEQKSYFQNTKF